MLGVMPGRRPPGRPDAQAAPASRPAGASRRPCPSAKIIMLTISDEEADLYEAIKSGATGYLLKDSSIEEVAQAIRVGRTTASR